jgi:Trypsin
MNIPLKTGRRSTRPYMTLEELVDMPSIPGTEEMPAEMVSALTRDHGIYIQSATKPKGDFVTEKAPGAPGIWRILRGPHGEEPQTFIPGQEEVALDAEATVIAKDDVIETKGFRPPWATLDLLPPLAPFRSGESLFLEPRAIEEGNRLSYPWRTIGIVFSSDGSQGSGVLVGPNLMLTAGHVAPWGRSPWSMEFIPAYRAGNRPFGSSFVQSYRGYNTRPEVSGHDYVICKLYTPLGQSLGWMGTQSWGDEQEYYRRRYVSSGYPGTFGTRPAVELDLGLRDIDNDSPGKELEFSLAGHPDIGPGWSGGPLWLPGEGPTVVGVLSGNEKDEFDPRFHVFAGGGGMVDLVRFGLDNWRP